MLRNLLFIFVLAITFQACAELGKGTQPTYTNHLVNESSPYLLQHAHNPVDWYPWGEAALQKAKEENKLIIISIGYSACHWCHVMEHESFEDTIVAQIMNEHFINIKVDREERPDVDDIYMTACQLSSGRACGWPLNAFALPDGRPVWAGTYFPKQEWIDVMQYFLEIKENQAAELETYAQQITEGIQSSTELAPVKAGEMQFSKDELATVVTTFTSSLDLVRGGRRGSPKFPMPTNYEFLLKYHHFTGDDLALDAVTTTLDNLAWGGIYDQLGGGFARYATDADWKIPHFEKMLYDNGQLVSLFSHAFQLTGKTLYQEVIDETLAFIERELSDPSGGFYSSLDADSEGEEGKFYVWTKAELEAALGDPELLQLFSDYYEVREKGNWEAGKNILHRKKSAEKIAETHGLTEEELQVKLESAKSKLLNIREKRVRPGLDDKMLTAWNALMLQGYVDAYRATGNDAYKDRALKNGAFLREKMIQADFRLNRNFKSGVSVINAFLDDYALTAQAFMGLYEITFDEQWLNDARSLTDYALEHFSEEGTVLLNYTSDLDPPLIARKKEIADNVIPASNSITARNLYRLGLYFYDQPYLERSQAMLASVWPSISDTETPSFYANWCSHYLDQAAPPYEVAIVGPEALAKAEPLLKTYLPNALLLGGTSEGNLELLKGKLQAGNTLIYVCQNKVCKLPVTEPEIALKQLN